MITVYYNQYFYPIRHYGLNLLIEVFFCWFQQFLFQISACSTFVQQMIPISNSIIHNVRKIKFNQFVLICIRDCLDFT